MPVQYEVLKRPFCLLLQFRGSVWCDVIPYCIINCGITYLAYYLAKNHIKVTFSAQGHALMSLMISYLVVSKVYLSLDRYMHARTQAGEAFFALRELYQIVLTFTEPHAASSAAQLWVRETREKIEKILQSTIRVVRSEDKSIYLARASAGSCSDEDPLVFVQDLRVHLYNDCHVFPDELQLLERVKLLDHLNAYVQPYKELLKLSSTPFPFPMIQMGRTFLFLWTFTMPFALVGIIDEIISVMVFVFFLTYGFVGLEFVSMQLLSPFGDGANDIDIVGMGEATLVGIRLDEQKSRGKTSSASALSKKRANPSNRYSQLLHSQQPSGKPDDSSSSFNAAGYISMDQHG